ncbi:hypothetical protein GY45DRAFT_754527 [Cubamyces sp. BRFM 1775]|nr:hypothetical protein GY45DRAFT_754527 [Cubamyces sp. BRFM 1775]
MPPSDVLLNPQIRAVLLKHLSPGTIPYGDPDQDGVALRHENQKTLARLAQVCRAISEPSLAVLWRSIDDFRFLLRPFKSYNIHSFMFTDVVTEDEWSRFCDYARRVRELRLSNVRKVHASTWTVLTRWCIREPLLPHLERLVDFEVSAMSACYAILLSPTIRHFGLRIDSDANDTIVCMGIQIAQPLFSQLESLFVYDKRYNYNNRKKEDVRFWEMSHLRELRVQHEVALNQKMVDALAASPHLHSLYINIMDMESMNGAKEAVPFPELRKLELVGTLGNINSFLEAAAPPCVEEVSLHASAEGDSGAKDATALLRTILSRLAPSTLRSIRVECTKRTHQDVRIGPEATLEQLATFPDLTSIVLTFADTLPFAVADDCLSSYSGTWPQLTAFEIHATPKDVSRRDDYARRGRGYGYGGFHVISSPDNHDRREPEPEPAPTIATVAAFASAHPLLKRFVLPTFDLTAVPDIASVPHLNHGLRTLKFVGLANGVPLLPFVLTFDLLFPRLDLATVETGLKPGSSPDRAQQLLAMLLTVQAGRVGAYRALRPDDGSDGAASSHGEMIKLIRPEQPKEKGRAIGDGRRSPSRDSLSPGGTPYGEVINRPYI